MRDSPDFVTENQKKLSDALTAYIRDIFSETAHAYIKNGMRIGAHLLLQLLNLE